MDNKRMDFIKVPRWLFDTGTFKHEPYTKREALLDLIQMAAYEDKEVMVNGETFKICRGQIAVSIRFLAKKWGWSNDKTCRTLNALKSEHFIERVTEHQNNRATT